MAVASYMVSIYITIAFSGVYIAVFIIMIFFMKGNAGTLVVISPHVILREAIKGLNGSDPMFTNTSTCLNEFKYCISFDLPASSGVDGLTKIVACGEVFHSSYDAEISVVRCVLMKLHEEHGYIIQDYSYIRGNICGLRYQDFVHKMDESKVLYEEIKESYDSGRVWMVGGSGSGSGSF
jgi:hypothetical protein